MRYSFCYKKNKHSFRRGEDLILDSEAHTLTSWPLWQPHLVNIGNFIQERERKKYWRIEVILYCEEDKVNFCEKLRGQVIATSVYTHLRHMCIHNYKAYKD